ncbi:MAG: hypothetical protein R3Y28_06135 [Candidatus Gastranaerophilales bacterium]
MVVNYKINSNRILLEKSMDDVIAVDTDINYYYNFTPFASKILSMFELGANPESLLEEYSKHFDLPDAIDSEYKEFIGFLVSKEIIVESENKSDALNVDLYDLNDFSLNVECYKSFDELLKNSHYIVPDDLEFPIDSIFKKYEKTVDLSGVCGYGN